MRLFLSAGEPSGDIHGASLIRAVRRAAPGTEFIGFGGPQMMLAGCSLLEDMTQHAVMWVWEAVKRYFEFKRLVHDADDYLSKKKPDAVVLIDFPGFNWHIAKAAKRHGIPVVYFMPPQLWAWAQWRVKKMRKYVDLVLCALPFEYRWFQKHGCRSVYIGHPFFEEIRREKSDPAFLEWFYNNYGNFPILTLLAGSRDQEVEKNFAPLVNTVKLLWKQCPNVLPVFAAFSERHRVFIQEQLDTMHLMFPVIAGRTAELIRAAECCLAVSGSVSLELLACNKPAVIYYKIGSLPLTIQRFFRRTRYITLVNLLAADRLRSNAASFDAIMYEDSVGMIPALPSKQDKERMLFPEFLTAADKTQEAAKHLSRWFSQPMTLAAQKQRMEALLAEVDNVESPLNAAAAAILEIIRS